MIGEIFEIIALTVNVNRDSRIVLIGYMNLSWLKWEFDPWNDGAMEASTTRARKFEKVFITQMDKLAIYQINPYSNIESRFVDLVSTNDTNGVNVTLPMNDDIIQMDGGHHCNIQIELTMPPLMHRREEYVKVVKKSVKKTYTKFPNPRNKVRLDQAYKELYLCYNKMKEDYYKNLIRNLSWDSKEFYKTHNYLWPTKT